MKKYFLVLFCFISALSAKAQQDALYTQYMFNTLAVNPAYAGSRNVLSATALLRTQWVGVEGAPETQTISFDAAMPNKRVGLGIQVFNDELGITKTTGAYASYAYRIPMNKGTLAFGLQGGFAQFRADFSSVQLNTGSPLDASFSQNINKTLPNFGFGVYYNTEKFYFGVATPHLLNNRFTDENSVAVSNNLIAKQYLHVFITSGYVFKLTNDFKLKPSFLIKGVFGAPIQADLSASLWIADRLSVGGQYRTGDAFSGLFELQVSEQFRVGYAYDHTVTKLGNYNSGSHEIMLRYEFGFTKDRIVAPRYF
ncbi:MAG: type IX secretion system membrane protein PorP/SprF [Pedobacter sp.]|nr:type IX secretion system membrane protein PorP/SprF [Pedobacter sp.]MDQ8051594.1 type IX secretion system membrane protein PorP/SprF [Pedobacter sp.]